MRDPAAARPAIRIHGAVHESRDHGRLHDCVAGDDLIRRFKIPRLIRFDNEIPDGLEIDWVDVAEVIHGMAPKVYLDAYAQQLHCTVAVERGGELAKALDIADMLEPLHQAAERFVLDACLIRQLSYGDALPD